MPTSLAALGLPTARSKAFFLTGLNTLAPGLLGAVIMGASSQIMFPYQIPVTAQTLAAAGLAVALSPGHTWLAMMTWITLGALGLPVFSGFSGGVGILMSQKAGFIWGMAVGAPLASWAYASIAQLENPAQGETWGGRTASATSGWKKSLAATGLAGLINSAVCLGLGWAWLSVLFGAQRTFLMVRPFFIIEGLKIAALMGFFSWANKKNKEQQPE